MKKLLIVLIDDPALDKSSTGCYMPGDTIAGNVTFHTSSSIKYTCIKIRFAGIVSTKVSKTTEDVYVLNQQVVLLGNANNASEFALQKGKYSWPFEFSVPWQHIPSSGKYRHGAVKYTLTATVSSKTFLGGMQETETNQTVQLKDLINCSQEPYSNPISVVGSSNTKPQTNKPKNLASATVQLSQSAYMKGQRLPITIDLAHTKGIQRDPGCWIQLLRKERYHAGEHDKEYTHICGTATEALYVDSGTNRGKILTHLNISDDALPTMTTTRIISMEYRLLILFDMRLRTGFMEGRARRTVNRKLRTKLLAAPGGFEIEVPVIIGTASENQYKPRLNPFDKTSSSGKDINTLVTSVVAATSQLSLPSPPHSVASPGLITAFDLAASPPLSPVPGTISLGHKNQTPSYTPQTQYRPIGASEGSPGYNKLPLSYRRQASEPNNCATQSTVSTSPDRSRSLFTHSAVSTAHNPCVKPLLSLPSPPSPPLPPLPPLPPPLPSTPTHAHISSALSTAPYALQEPSDISQSHYFEPSSSASSSSPLCPSGLHHHSAAMVSSFNGSSSSMTGLSAHISSSDYLLEKVSPSLQRHLHIQPPMSIQVPSPSAPHAVDLGMGPASPEMFSRRVSHNFSLWGAPSLLMSNGDSSEAHAHYGSSQQPSRSGDGFQGPQGSLSTGQTGMQPYPPASVSMPLHSAETPRPPPRNPQEILDNWHPSM